MLQQPSRGERIAVPANFRSAERQIRWPALPDANAAAQAALQFQLELTQWWSPAELLQQQLAQLTILVGHAHRTVPIFRERLHAAGIGPDVPLTPDLWGACPS